MGQAKTRFTIDVNGEPKTVFSIFETKCGDLNLHITGKGKAYKTENLSNLVVVPDDAVFESYDMHISMHLTPTHPEVNLIKWTQEFSNRKEEIYHPSTAIKQDNLFAPVLFRVCGDLAADRYSIKDKPGELRISLGAYDPRRGQLRFMVVCSRPNKPFQKIDDHPSNLTQHIFSNFTLTVIWSYLNMPSHPQAIDFFLGAKNDGANPIRGFNEAEIYNMYTDLYMRHAQEYLNAYGDDGCSVAE
jgi:hypothetical protein